MGGDKENQRYVKHKAHCFSVLYTSRRGILEIEFPIFLWNFFKEYFRTKIKTFGQIGHQISQMQDKNYK